MRINCYFCYVKNYILFPNAHTHSLKLFKIPIIDSNNLNLFMIIDN